MSEASANLVYACEQWEIDLGLRELRSCGIPVPLRVNSGLIFDAREADVDSQSADTMTEFHSVRPPFRALCGKASSRTPARSSRQQRGS
jgi:hypothetical protein